MAVTEAAYLVNEYLKDDSVLKSILGNSFNIFPLIADEPTDDTPSYPYIRYMSVPIVDRDHWRIRRDAVQYIIGSKNYQEVGRILERLMDLLHIDDNIESELSIKDTNYKIMSITASSGTAPRPPDQEGGVIERGIGIVISYTKLQETS